MEKAIESLEHQRKSLYKKLQQTGDFRRGTISVNYRKCGKKNCVCSKKGHPGRGPQYLWNTTLKGKSYAKSLKLGPEIQKYKEEIENYHHFQQLCAKIIRVNEEICKLRPLPVVKNNHEMEELKKKLQEHFRKKYKKK